MQFEQVDEATRIDLPKPSIDTGMGAERFAAIMQGVHSVFDIDLFRHIIEASTQYAGHPRAASHRIIADHLRSSAFLIADGVLPSNEGRGYVLRRIMRRAMRHAHILGTKEPLMYRLVPVLSGLMGGAYPELKRAEALISETLKLEETRFRDTLARGLKLLEEATTGLDAGDSLAGEIAFKLYDTFGFPLDLTQDALRHRGIAVDVDGFKAAMAKQRDDARRAWSGSGEAATDTLWFSLREELGTTEFLGYDTEEAEGEITALIKDGARVDTVKAGETVRILTNQTPFYGESGGQVGDRGLIFSSRGRGRVIDTEKKLGAIHVHVVEVTEGTFVVGDAVDLKVDGEARRATRANHSATHLLHASLKHVLGPHVAQKGSSVGPERLRFDFSHPKAVTADELERVETEVNAIIRQNSDVSTRLMPTDQAIEAGAEALFGEKYGDEVRVLTMGEDDAREKPFSVELCGGTHVKRTGDIAVFKIVSEGAVSAGVRRIEALTGAAALEWFRQQEKTLREAADALKTTTAELPARVSQLVEERRKLEKEIADLRRQAALGGGGVSSAEAPKKINGVTFVSRVLTDIPAKDLKPMADAFKAQVKSGVITLVASYEDKVSIVVAVTDDLTGQLGAVELAKAGAAAVGGLGGGGRPDMAQAGGTDISAMPQAIAAIERILETKTKAA
jgi:alanyl-tRNA synthetase